ncbi:hypothetical protein K438DRAFT_1009789 [Mycena galopus ATCC 62051]|nr:hypothetical protein K438DRAFT_1009789 [Mycena galopus ATCC 62051]
MNNRHGEPGRHILYRAATGDASHDSEDRFPQPRCHPKTREEMLDVLLNWTSGIEPPARRISGDYAYHRLFEANENEAHGSSSDIPSSPILWLHGPAGAGKSAIAQSLCQKLEADGRLGASFFFKRGHPSRGHVKRLVATIAYQLALRLPDFNDHVSRNVENDPSLVDKSFSIQVEKLIVEPSRRSQHPSPALVVVIDGLDECDRQTVQQEILHSIGRAVHDQQLPLRFLVASRPEPHIRESFAGALFGLHCPVNIEESFKDVRKYLLDEFARVQREHRGTMTMVPSPWPSPETIQKLVDKSSGYFIYASTVIKFIDDRNFRPTQRLDVIMGVKEPECGSPVAALDQLYTQILSQVSTRPQLLQILAALVAQINLPVGYLEQLLELERGDVPLALRGLHSVISGLVNENGRGFSDWSLGQGIGIHHASFRDFLQDPTRAGIFYVGGGPCQTELARHILKAFSHMPDAPRLDRRPHVAWYLPIESLGNFMASTEPSSDLVSLLHFFNPDFLFQMTNDRDQIIASVLN